MGQPLPPGMSFNDDGTVATAPAPSAGHGPWEQFQGQAPAAPAWQSGSEPVAGPWQSYAQQGPRIGSGIVDAITAGWQGSATGLAWRGKLPDVVLDPQHSKWYEKLVSGAAQMGAEAPEMFGGMVAGGAAGSEVPIVGNVIGAGAGAFAVPTAIRTALTEAYSKGAVTSAADFLSRTGITLAATGKDALVGGLTAGVGSGVGKLVAPLVGEGAGIGARIGAGFARGAAEVGTMTTASAALQGKLPEPEDFMNAAIMVGGMHMAGLAAGRLREVYAQTGIRPEQVVAEAQSDPTIKEDLTKPLPQAEVAPSMPQDVPIVFRRGLNLADTEKTLAGLPGVPEGFTRLFRGSSPTDGFDGTFDASQLTDHAPDRPGEHYTDDFRTADYFRASYGKDANVSYLDVPTEIAEQAKVRDGEYILDLGKGAPQDAGKVHWDPSTWPEASQDIPRAYQDAASAQAAADAFTGDKAQQVLDSPYADLPEAKQPYQLNLKYINAPEDLQALQTRMAEVYRKEIDTARGGTQTWDETANRAAQQIAAMTGTDLQKVMAGRNPGDTSNAVQLKIQGDLLMQSTTEAAAAIKALKDAGINATEAQKMDALAAIHRSAMIQANFTGASSELGRALNYLQSIKEVKAQGAGLQKLVELYGGDPSTLLKMAGDMDSPEALSKFSREATQANTWDKVIEAWKAGIVSGPITHIKKFLGNLTLTALHPVVDAAASVIGAATGAENRVTAMEPLARIFGNLAGVKDGLKLALSTLMDTGGAEQGSTTATESEHRANAIPGTLGDVVRTPFRLLGADGALFRTVNERGEAYALAVRQASRENLNPLTDEWRQRVAELANNPKPEDLAGIQAFGLRSTFHAPMGDTTQKLSDFVNSARFKGAPLLKFIFPFIGTPANIFKEMARLTPLAPAVPEWRAAIAEGGPRAHQALAELALGTGAAALVTSLALSGQVSGSGDPDPEKRRVALASGWQPYSVKIGDKWISYQNFHPVGTSIGMAADMAEVWKHATPEEQDKIPKILSTAFANSITNQTFLAGLATFVDALSNPDGKGPRFISKLASGFVPNIIGQTAQLTDPFKRETDSIKAAVQSRIPGLREMLPVQRDPWGEAIPNDERAGYVSPILEKTQSTDLVRTEAARLGIGAAKTPQSIQLPAAGQHDLGKVDLSPEQRDVFGDTAGHLAHAIMAPIVNSPTWESTPDMVKAMVYHKALSEGERVGKATAISPEERQQEVLRIVAALNTRIKQ